MWIHTRLGFFSVVQLDSSDDHLLVRARVSEDLERLADALGVSHNRIDFNESADYAWRLGLNGEVPKEAFAALVARLVFDIDFTSHVKEELTKPGGSHEPDRYTWYLSTWSAGMRMQEKRLGRSTTSAAETTRLWDRNLQPLDDGLTLWDAARLWDGEDEDDDDVDLDSPPLHVTNDPDAWDDVDGWNDEDFLAFCYHQQIDPGLPSSYSAYIEIGD